MRTRNHRFSLTVTKALGPVLLLLFGGAYVAYSCSGDDEWELARQKKDETLLAERRDLIRQLESTRAQTMADFEGEFGTAYCACNPDGAYRYPSLEVRFGGASGEQLCSGDCGGCFTNVLTPLRGPQGYEGCYVSGAGPKDYRELKGWFRCAEVPMVASCSIRKAVFEHRASAFAIRNGMESAKYKYPSLDGEWLAAHGFKSAYRP